MYRVLVVEADEPPSATGAMLQMRLGLGWPGSGAGMVIAVDTASTLEEALEYLRAEPDALVIDAGTLLTGEIAHLARAARSLPKPVYVLLTDDVPDDNIAALAELVDANGWLARPFSVEQIAQEIGDWFRRLGR